MSTDSAQTDVVPNDLARPDARLANLPQGDIIVFDGVCHLCNGWVQFLLRVDRQQRYRFASMQSATGQALLQRHGLDPLDPTSFLLLRDGQAHTNSDAILDVLTGLAGGWHLLSLVRIVPRLLRDPAYRWLARHRYRLLGKREVCMMPSAEQAGRFID